MTQPDPIASTASGDMLVDEVADWLMTQALGDTVMQDTFDGCCKRLHAVGVPVTRCYLAYRTLHPLVKAVTLTWRRNQPLERIAYAHGDDDEGFTLSPLHHLIESGLPYLRRRLEREEDAREFPVLGDLWQQGITDYLAYLIPFGERSESDFMPSDGMIGSWATDRPGGFSADDLATLRRIGRRLAVACKIQIKEEIARNVLDAYLGSHSGRQVLQGRIRRGDGETIHAVVWFCDLRESTRLSASMPLEDYLATLNEFFECMAGAVLDAGGEVLRFIGDAVLAIFPMPSHHVSDPTACPLHREACRRALDAAREAEERLERLNQRRRELAQPALDFGIGLHVGDVMYGNIGAPQRVEFSVVGPAANKAARVESLCKRLDTRLVVSAEFAAILGEDWQTLGSHALAGIDSDTEIFTLPRFAAS